MDLFFGVFHFEFFCQCVEPVMSLSFFSFSFRVFLSTHRASNVVIVPLIHRFKWFVLLLSIHLSLHPSIHLSIYFFIYLSFHLSIWLSIYLSRDMCIHLSICLSIYLPVSLSIDRSINLSIYWSIYPYIYLSIDRSIYLSINLSNPKRDDPPTPSFFQATTLKVNTLPRGNMAT